MTQLLDDARLHTILTNLTRPIPAPYIPPPIPQATWRTLHPAQLLTPTSTNPLVQDGVWQVVGCDDQGITLSPEGASPFDPTVRWCDPDWRAHWTKVPKRRAPKARNLKTPKE